VSRDEAIDSRLRVENASVSERKWRTRCGLVCAVLRILPGDSGQGAGRRYTNLTLRDSLLDLLNLDLAESLDLQQRSPRGRVDGLYRAGDALAVCKVG